VLERVRAPLFSIPDRALFGYDQVLGKLGEPEAELAQSVCKSKETNIMPMTIEVEQELDGRWLAEVPDLPGVLAYGHTRQEAIEQVQVLSLRVLADRLNHGEPVPQVNGVFAVTP
jgi:predicted RNase H-like HicB family nuclease